MAVQREIIDVHAHTTNTPEMADRIENVVAGFGRYSYATSEGCACGAKLVDGNGNVQRKIEENAYDAATRDHECAHTPGNARQVISPTPMQLPDAGGIEDVQKATEICRLLNEGNAAMVAKFPERFPTFLAAVPLGADVPAAIKEMARAKADGAHGIALNSNINGRDLDDPAFFPLFEAASETGMAVFIHPWAGFMMPGEEGLKTRMNPGRDWLPWLVGMPTETAIAFNAMYNGGVHERLPKLKVLYVHGGGAIPALLGRLEHGKYCRPDLFKGRSTQTPYETIQKCGVYVDSLTHNPWAFELLLNTFGPERIAVGSDYPYPLGEMEPYDAKTGKDNLGNDCPYAQRKGIFPGHMAMNLPEKGADMHAAFDHFNWLPRTLPGGKELVLPTLSEAERQRILSGTAKEWLGL